MAARPTAVQESAIRAAMASDRVGCTSGFTDRTLATMVRNGWITRPNSWTYRVTPEAAYVLGLITLGDRYKRSDDLDVDPATRRQQAVVELANAYGVGAVPTGTASLVTISVEDLEHLLTIGRDRLSLSVA